MQVLMSAKSVEFLCLDTTGLTMLVGLVGFCLHVSYWPGQGLGASETHVWVKLVLCLLFLISADPHISLNDMILKDIIDVKMWQGKEDEPKMDDSGLKTYDHQQIKQKTSLATPRHTDVIDALTVIMEPLMKYMKWRKKKGADQTAVHPTKYFISSFCTSLYIHAVTFDLNLKSHLASGTEGKRAIHTSETPACFIFGTTRFVLQTLLGDNLTFIWLFRHVNVKLIRRTHIRVQRGVWRKRVRHDAAWH